MKKVCELITRYLAVIVLAAALASFLFPAATGVIKTSWITPLLGCVMFGMGMNLNVQDLAAVFRHTKAALIGCACQFLIMPSLAYVLCKAFSLPPELAIGVILVGCCPGGTSSNVITYLCKGDVALSVAMTAMSTILAPVLTPLLVKLLAGAMIPVDFLGMFLSIVEVVLVPIALGLAVKKLLPRPSAACVPYLPAFSAIVITMIVMAVVSANADRLHSCGLMVIVVVVLHNMLGYGLGFAVGRVLKMDSAKCKALSIEVGMQNSGLACSLAAAHFASLALAGVPGAIFSVWHNISGALMARLYLGRGKQ